MKTEIDTRTEQKGMGKLDWFMSKTSATSPPREGEPAGTPTASIMLNVWNALLSWSK